MQMTQELTVFKFNKHTIRRVPGGDGKIHYCVTDVCASLGIKRTKDVIARLMKGGDNNPILSGGITWIESQTAGGIQRLPYTDEVGLYDTISKSRKPLAKLLYRQLIEAVPSMRGSTGRSTPGIVSTEQVIIDTHNIVKVFDQKVDARLNRLEQMVSVIQSNQELGVKLLKKSTLPEINIIDWRARLNQDIRNISLKFNWPEHDCWNMVYYEDKYRNHRDIKAIARNRGCRPIHVAEEKGWLPDLCAIAKAILSGEITSSYKLFME